MGPGKTGQATSSCSTLSNLARVGTVDNEVRPGRRRGHVSAGSSSVLAGSRAEGFPRRCHSWVMSRTAGGVGRTGVWGIPAPPCLRPLGSDSTGEQAKDPRSRWGSQEVGGEGWAGQVTESPVWGGGEAQAVDGGRSWANWGESPTGVYTLGRPSRVP